MSINYLYQLFSNSNLSKKSDKATYEEFKKVILKRINNINSEAEGFLKEKYKEYEHLYEVVTIKSITEIPSLLGFDPCSTSLKYFTSRGWDETESQKRLKARQGTLSIENLCKKFNVTEEEAKVIKKERLERGIKTVKNREDYDQVKYAKGNSMRADFYVTKINPNTGELFTEEEAKGMLFAKSSRRSKLFWDDVRAGKKVYVGNSCLQYYINQGNSKEDAEKLLKIRQTTFSLERCIENLGEEQGLLRWQERQLKWQNTLKALPPEEQERILIAKTTWSKKYSKEATKFILKLLEALKIDQFEDDVWMCDRERFILARPKIFFYDLYIGRYNLYLEYNGSCYHPNPKKLATKEKWDLWVHPTLKISATEQREKDETKKNLVLEKGGIFFEVWDTDDHNATIKNICNFIKKEKI